MTALELGLNARSGNLCQSPAMPDDQCRMHGRMSPGASTGNRNAFKHGACTAEPIQRSREVADLLRLMRTLVEEID